MLGILCWVEFNLVALSSVMFSCVELGVLCQAMLSWVVLGQVELS